LKMRAKTKKRNFLKILIPVLLLTMALFYFTSLGEITQNFFLKISSPLKSVFWMEGTGVSSLFGCQESIVSLRRENRELQSEISRLENLEKENIFLKEALDLELEEEFDLLFSKVIGRDLDRNFLVLNKGEKDGLEEGMTVITSKNSLVGKIEKVLPNFSYLRLILDRESSFDGHVKGKENSYGVIRGEGDRLILDLIPREAKIEEGDRVVTLPLGGIYPEGILVGVVEEVVREDAEAFLQAFFRPEFNPREMNNLLIITGF